MARKEKVTRVIDGDTFETDRRKNPVRLANVDTPEKGEPGYQKAKDKLSELIMNKEVTSCNESKGYIWTSRRRCKGGR